jgi:hypothetical protein
MHSNKFFVYWAQLCKIKLFLVIFLKYSSTYLKTKNIYEKFLANLLLIFTS